MDIADWLSRQAGRATYFSHEEDKFMEAADTIRRLRGERDAALAEVERLKDAIRRHTDKMALNPADWS